DRDEEPHRPRLGRALESGGLHLVGDEQDHERDRQHEREPGEEQCAQARVTLDGRLDLVNDGAHALAISTSHADRYALAWSLCNGSVSERFGRALPAGGHSARSPVPCVRDGRRTYGPAFARGTPASRHHGTPLMV